MSLLRRLGQVSGMFDETRLAQMAAFFADKSADRRIGVLKLMKLLYLADRTAMQRYGSPITFCRMVSMDHGPVLSQALNFCSGLEPSDPWGEWMSPRAGNSVELAKSVSRQKLDELSDADVEVLEYIWDQFGRLTGSQLRNWTHENCPEWRDPHGSSLRIKYADVFRALGRSPDEARDLEIEIRGQERVSQILAG